jgi:RHH-type proline utilization regulon transcriptional repressor/proline dehydrogenase/delta 1-pyrroline-5-carboxylate dehydrogenase
MGAPEFTSNLEPQIADIGARLHALALRAKPSLFNGQGLRGRLAARALADEQLRTALFTFVDTLPQLESNDELARHFRAYLQGHDLGGLWGRLLRLGNYPLLAPAVRASVQRLAREFLVAEDERSIAKVLRRVGTIPASATFDAVGEAVLTEAEAEHYVQRNLRLLDWLAAASSAPPAISVKLSALTARFDPIDPIRSKERALTRLRPLLARAAELGAAVTVDMEQHELKGLIVDAFLDMLAEFPQTGWQPGIALQAYAPDTPGIVERVISSARERGRKICIRLVKGAYWDTEVALAQQRNWPAPVFLDKGETDAQYESLTALLFDHADVIYPAIAGHNLRSLSHAIAAARVRGLAPDRWEVQMLLGMANPLAEAVAGSGVKLRMYIPMGDLLAGIAYLIRRLMENTANNSVLRQTYVEAQDVGQLLKQPQPPATAPAPAAATGFQSMPLLDFSRPAVQASFRQALNDVARDFGKAWPLDIAGSAKGRLEVQSCINPARPSQVLGSVELGEIAHAEQAIANAVRAFDGWRETPAERRAELCLRAADLMSERRKHLAALEVFEVGKNWREADADVAEAIDYLRFYAQQMQALAGRHPTICYSGEPNHLVYEPRGVAVVIAPWNFPLAILTGMTTAALVAGNPAIMKPAGPSTLLALQLLQILRDAGIPRDVCQLIPGNGPQIGAHLVDHKDVAIIAFTGSREVGLSILQRAAMVHPGQREVKRVVCEMGGKNAIIVDRDADLDEAVLHTLLSAFGYQGQKCSAASRVIVVGEVHDRFVARLAEALDCYTYGAPEDPTNIFGPVITGAAQRRIEGYVEVGRSEGRLAYRGKVRGEGFYVAPAIFTGIEPGHRLAREEIFGPVLSVMRAGDFESAMAMALDSDFALTGGVFSRLPEHIELARRRFRVGNLYINRKITGATVGAQPFGGMRMSGTGVQAGGPDYLKQFLWTRVISENTLRHGFVPPPAS